jgi:hypothetical protein
MRGRSPGASSWVQQRYAAVTTWTDGLVTNTANSLDIDAARAAAEDLAKERC